MAWVANRSTSVRKPITPMIAERHNAMCPGAMACTCLAAAADGMRGMMICSSWDCRQDDPNLTGSEVEVKCRVFVVLMPARYRRGRTARHRPVMPVGYEIGRQSAFHQWRRDA